MSKLPPIEKVYEAWSAIADGRAALTSPDSASVTSSDLSKVYTIRRDPATGAYLSNDNATFWAGYPGYPILAMLMLEGKLPFDPDFAKLWKGINWTELNKKMKRDYAAAVAYVEAERGIDPAIASRKAEEAMEALKALGIATKRLTGISASPNK